MKRNGERKDNWKEDEEEQVQGSKNEEKTRCAGELKMYVENA